MNIQRTKYNLRLMTKNQKIMLDALMAENGCKNKGYMWCAGFIWAHGECDYYMYIDKDLNIKFGYGDWVFIRSEFTDKTNFSN